MSTPSLLLHSCLVFSGSLDWLPAVLPTVISLQSTGGEFKCPLPPMTPTPLRKYSNRHFGAHNFWREFFLYLDLINIIFKCSYRRLDKKHPFKSYLVWSLSIHSHLIHFLHCIKNNINISKSEENCERFGSCPLLNLENIWTNSWKSNRLLDKLVEEMGSWDFFLTLYPMPLPPSSVQ